MTELPRRAIVRSAKLASLPLGMAGRAAIGAGKRLGGRPAELVAEELRARTAEQLFSVLGELKGGAMKVGQALSILEAAMPEEVARPYRAMLTKLQEAAPPLPAETVHRVLVDELGPRWRTKFAEFDDVPVASASVGQVHRAIWKDGREVAVKIQYPGAGSALIGDFTRLARVTKVSAGWVPGLDLEPLLKQFIARVRDELDYELEASRQKAFGAAFDGDPHVFVPAVVHQRGTVLVTEWMGGTPLSLIITQGTREQRNVAATRYLEFLLTGPELAHLLHADPHPGNFRLLDDGRLGVMDFGSVDELPDGLPTSIGRLLGAALDEDAHAIVRGLRDEGFIRSGIEIDAWELLDFLLPFLDPLRSPTFAFDRPWLRQQYERLQDPRANDWRVSLKLNLPPEYLLIHRVWLGGLGVLCQLGGDIEVRGILADWMPGLELAEVDELRCAGGDERDRP